MVWVDEVFDVSGDSPELLEPDERSEGIGCVDDEAEWLEYRSVAEAAGMRVPRVVDGVEPTDRCELERLGEDDKLGLLLLLLLLGQSVTEVPDERIGLEGTVEL